MPNKRLENGRTVRTVKLSRKREGLGGDFLEEGKWLARKEGCMGVVLGADSTTEGVYLVIHRENDGTYSCAAYGEEELGPSDAEGDEEMIFFQA